MGGNQPEGRDTVCLLCLEFRPFNGDSQLNQSTERNAAPAPKDQEITLKFIKFCKTFLQVQTDVNWGQLWKGLSKKGPWGSLCFCRDCEVLVKNVLRLHSDLNVIKARLLWKVSELRKVIVISQSNGSLSSGGVGKKGSSRFEHLKGSSCWVDVEILRKNLMFKCTEKSRRLLPFVVLNKNVNTRERCKLMEMESRKDKSSIVVPAKSDLHFMISLIIMFCLTSNWSLREIADKQTENFSWCTMVLPMDDNADERLKPKSNSVTQKRTHVRKRTRGKSLDEPDSVTQIKEEISNIHDAAAEASGNAESNNTCNLNYDDMDRNSDVSMNFSESNFDDVEIANSPDFPVPAQAEDKDNKPLLPISDAAESVMLKRRLRKELGVGTGFVIEQEPDQNVAEGESAPPASSSSYGLRHRSITADVPQEPDSGDDSSEGSDKQEYKPPRKVLRRRKSPTKGVNTNPMMNNRKIDSGGTKTSQPGFKFKCSVCNKHFRSMKERQLHKRQYRHFYQSALPNGTRKHEPAIKCDICQESCWSYLRLYEHVVNAHGGGPDKLQLYCKICKDTTSTTGTIRALLNHLRDAHENPNDKSHFCPNCPESYTTPQRLELHRKLAHWKLPPLFCDDNDCSQSFALVEDLNSHMREDPSHQNREMLHCQVCKRGFFSSFHCRLHELNHLARDEKGLMDCPGENCWRKFLVMAPLQNHFNTAHFSFDERVKFFACPKRHKFSTFSKGELEWHMKKHLSQSKYYCEACDLDCGSFRNKNYHEKTLRHLEKTVEMEERKSKQVQAESKEAEEDQGGASETTTGVNSEPLINCGICEENFTSQAKRQLHRKRAHRKHYKELRKSDFICEVCAESFENWSGLQRHMIVHAEPQFQCPHCKKFYRRDYTLKYHINRKHTQSDMYVCEVCGKACPNRSEYNYHKSEHLLLHSCHLCPKKFSRGWSLKGHMRVHTGEKLQCEWCPVTYAALGNMKTHVKESHPEEYQYHYGREGYRTSLRFKIVKPSENEGGDDASSASGIKSNPYDGEENRQSCSENDKPIT